VNLFTEEKIPIVGPQREAAILEGSKAYTKLLCREIGVPAPEFEVFDDPEKAKGYIEYVKYPVVVKADGLAQGKGSIVCSNTDEAFKAVDQLAQTFSRCSIDFSLSWRYLPFTHAFN
jgi:phosphoribosylamine-glycine ligase